MINAFQDYDNLYLVMDLLSGGDLRYHICKYRRFKEDQTKFWIGCLLLGLDYIHSNNIIHRDIKPENLVCDENGYVRITDFGVAKIHKSDNSSETSGTPGYMAPEVLIAKNHSFPVDFFAIGVMGYEFMLGQRPYLGKNRKEIKQVVLRKQVIVSDEELPDNWSFESQDFINKCLQRKECKRLGFMIGVKGLKEHPWFNDFDWNSLYHKTMKSPFIPKESGNFDKKYCEHIDEHSPETIERYQNYMRDNNFTKIFINYTYLGELSKYIQEDENQTNKNIVNKKSDFSHFKLANSGSINPSAICKHNNISNLADYKIESKGNINSNANDLNNDKVIIKKNIYKSLNDLENINNNTNNKIINSKEKQEDNSLSNISKKNSLTKEQSATNLNNNSLKNELSSTRLNSNFIKNDHSSTKLTISLFNNDKTNNKLDIYSLNNNKNNKEKESSDVIHNTPNNVNDIKDTVKDIKCNKITSDFISQNSTDKENTIKINNLSEMKSMNNIFLNKISRNNIFNNNNNAESSDLSKKNNNDITDLSLKKLDCSYKKLPLYSFEKLPKNRIIPGLPLINTNNGGIKSNENNNNNKYFACPSGGICLLNNQSNKKLIYPFNGFSRYLKAPYSSYKINNIYNTNNKIFTPFEQQMLFKRNFKKFNGFENNLVFNKNLNNSKILRKSESANLLNNNHNNYEKKFI